MLLEDCKLCIERKYAHKPVPGDGNTKLAKTCLLGRNPGANEDRQGIPFIGRAGQKLNIGLVTAKILRRVCYVTNVVKCMTPKDVQPSPQCRAVCSRIWLDDEFRAMESLELVVTLGNEALQYFEPLGRVGMLHGTHFQTNRPWDAGSDIEIFVSYHPSAALRSSRIDTDFMKDMGKLRELLHGKETKNGQS